MSARNVAASVACASALLLAGCTDDESSGTGTTVVASAYPFAWLVERVGGGTVDVDNLTGPGVEPHDVELTPQQVAEVSEADLVVYEAGFQPAIDDALEQAGLADAAVLDVADTVPLRETGSADGAALDPHVWLDPRLMVTITEAVEERLADDDPEHADAYRRNADALVGDLIALDRAYVKGLARCERSTVVTTHDAFGYLGSRYGLDVVSIAGIDPTQEPAPAEQAAIADTVRAEGVTTIFTEELVSPAVADSIAAETGAETATLSPVEGLTDDTADEDYLSLMRANLGALEEANGCS